MKAVVVEIKNNRAAVLSDNGCVVNVKNNGYEVGQVIHMMNSKAQLTKKIAAFAASAAAFVIFGTGTWAYATPYSYVSVDVNPSIEYTINRFDRVLSVKAVNDDGEAILHEISLENLENKTIESAILKTVEQITATGYFSETTEGGIVITTASENDEKAEELATDLQQSVEEITEVEEDVTVEAYSVGLERVEEARELGVTPGKLNLVEKLQASSADPDEVNMEEWLNKSVKDIMKATKDNKTVSTVTGSAITMDEEAIDKAAKEKAKEEKRQEREAEKQKKKEEKTIRKSEEKKEDKNDITPKQADKDSKKSDKTPGKKEDKNNDPAAKNNKSNNTSSEKAKITAPPKSDKKDAVNNKPNKKNKTESSDREEDSDTDYTDPSAKPSEDDRTSPGQDHQNKDNSGNSGARNKGGSPGDRAR